MSAKKVVERKRSAMNANLELTMYDNGDISLETVDLAAHDAHVSYQQAVVDGVRLEKAAEVRRAAQKAVVLKRANRGKVVRVISAASLAKFSKVISDTVDAFVAEVNAASGAAPAAPKRTRTRSQELRDAHAAEEREAKRLARLNDPKVGHIHAENAGMSQEAIDFIVEQKREAAARKAAQDRFDAIQRTLPLGPNDWS